MPSSQSSSMGSGAMEEEDDDLYGTGPSSAPITGPPFQVNGDQQADGNLESGEEEEEDDSESDIEIVTEKKDQPDSALPSRFVRTEANRDTPSSQQPTTQQPAKQSSAVKIVDPSQPQQSARRNPNQPILLPGNKYPAIRSSTIDPSHVPLWNGKPITDIDIDADLANEAMPWRRPGADQSDYFNYGFDEFTWSTYQMHQKKMRGQLDDQKAEIKSFENTVLSMGLPMPPGMPGVGTNNPMPGVPTGLAVPVAPQGMPGMPSDQDMQAMFMQAMAAQGANDPSQLDFGAFMQQMGGPGGMPGGGMGVPTGPSGGGQQQGWGGQQAGGFQQQNQGGRTRRGGRW